MPRHLEHHSKLRRIRDALGFSAQQVANLIALLLGERTRTGASVSQIEQRGTKDIYVIAALAQIYKRPFGEIACLANPESAANKVLVRAIHSLHLLPAS